MKRKAGEDESEKEKKDESEKGQTGWKVWKMRFKRGIRSEFGEDES